MNSVIIDAMRTPIGQQHGKLSGWHPVDLLSECLSALVARNGIDPILVEDVIAGCVSQAGEQSMNIARNAVLAAGFPESVAGTTVDRQCGSAQQAIHFAAQAVESGACELVIAAGVESMSRVPAGSAVMARQPGVPFGSKMIARYSAAGGLVPQGIAAELIADEYNLTREDLDEYSLAGNERALVASKNGYFESEVLPLNIKDSAGHATSETISVDECINPSLTKEDLRELQPIFKVDGKVTVGNSAPISDGASAILIAGEEKSKELGLSPRARFAGFGIAGVDPMTMLTGAIPASNKAAQRAGIDLGAIDVSEIHESYASVVLAWQKETGFDLEKINMFGGAIALGNPIGCSGARSLTTLINVLEREGRRFGLLAASEAGGLANAAVIERC